MHHFDCTHSTGYKVFGYESQEPNYNYTDWLHTTTARPGSSTCEVREQSASQRTSSPTLLLEQQVPPSLSSCTTLTPSQEALQKSSTTSLAADQLEVLPYYIATQYATPLPSFDKFIQELDGGVGRAERTEYRQTYQTRLTLAQADAIEGHYSFVLMVYADVACPEDFEDGGWVEEFCARN